MDLTAPLYRHMMEAIMHDIREIGIKNEVSYEGVKEFSENVVFTYKGELLRSLSYYVDMWNNDKFIKEFINVPELRKITNTIIELGLDKYDVIKLEVLRVQFDKLPIVEFDCLENTTEIGVVVLCGGSDKKGEIKINYPTLL